MALEEFLTFKHGNDEDLKNGRCDLFVEDVLQKKTYAIEAKHALQNIGERCEDKYLNVKRKFNGAWRDASKLHKSEAAVRVAACFVVPQLPLGEAEDRGVSVMLDEWLNGISAKIKADALAWVFPKASRDLCAEDGKLYPGVCLLLRVRARARRKI